jgi:hypothetical protein
MDLQEVEEHLAEPVCKVNEATQEVLGLWDHKAFKALSDSQDPRVLTPQWDSQAVKVQ